MEKVYVVLSVLVIAIIGCSVLALGSQLGVISLANVGVVKAIGVDIFEDQALTIPTINISWGMISPGDSAFHTMWIKNTGNVDVTLRYNCSLFAPPLTESVVFTSWSYAGEFVAPNNALRVDFTITIAADPQGLRDFGFTVTIIGDSI